MRRLALLLTVALLYAAPAYAQIARVNSTSAAVAAGAATTQSLTSFAVTTGNSIFVITRTDDNPVTGVVDTAGNTYTLVGSENTYTYFSMWKACSVAGNASDVITITYAGSSTYRASLAVQYSGIAAACQDQVATGSITLAATVTSGAFTTTQADEVIVAGVQVSNIGVTWTAGSTYTTNATEDLLMIEDRIVSSIQTGITAAATSSDASSHKTIVVGTFVKAATGGGGGPTQHFGTIMGAGR